MGELPQTFFDQTPRLFAAVVDGRARMREAEEARMAWAVHQNAALCLSDPKKFPTLERFLRPVRRASAKPVTEPKSAPTLEAICRQWQAALSNKGGIDLSVAGGA